MVKYFTYFILLGAIITLAYNGMEDALGVMYISPLEQQNFGAFFFIMALIVVIIGVFFQWVIPLKLSIVKMDIYGPILMMIIAVIIGNIYSHRIKTDEFLYYFILTHVVTMFAVLSAGRQLSVFVKIGDINTRQALLCICATALGTGIVYIGHALIGNFILLTGIWNIYLALALAILSADWSGGLLTREKFTRMSRKVQ